MRKITKKYKFAINQAQEVLFNQALESLVVVLAALEVHQLSVVLKLELVDNKMKTKKAITQLFPVNQKSTIQSSQRSQKLLSIALNKNFQDITLMLKLAAKFSTFVLSTTHANMISSAQMEQFS
jgi:hypothetical protein